MQDDGAHLLPHGEKVGAASNGKSTGDATALIQEITQADLENQEGDLVQHYVVSDDEKEDEVATTRAPKLAKASGPKPRSQKASQTKGMKSSAKNKNSKSMPQHVPAKSQGVSKKGKRKTSARNKHGR